MAGKVLIVEDEFIIAQDLRMILEKLGYAVMGWAKSVGDALGKLEKELPDIAMLDINLMGEETGIDLAKKIEDRYQIPYFYVTSYSDDKTLNDIKQTNPKGYILKPFETRDIRVALEVNFKLQQHRKDSQQKALKKPKILDDTVEVIGESTAIREALLKINQVAETDVTVLIQGETGTGKELFMQVLHERSRRSSKNLVKVNCAALPAELIESALFGHEKGSFTGATEKRVGKFEAAHGGTLFLDEIGELPLGSQAKLLRCLQEKEIEPVGGTVSKKVDVRIVAATNRDLAEEVRKGNFRADLFFRLSIFPIGIPPLRERGADALLLAKHYMKLGAKSMGKPAFSISAQTEKKILNYHWPGNVRELQHTIQRGIIVSQCQELELQLEAAGDISGEIASQSNDFKLKSLEEREKEQIIETLNYCNGKIRGKDGAAAILKLHPNTLDFRIKKLGIAKDKLNFS